jgi:hypothetical protein
MHLLLWQHKTMDSDPYIMMQTTQYMYLIRGRYECDCMIVEFITNYAISAYHHQPCDFNSHSWRSVTLYNIMW